MRTSFFSDKFISLGSGRLFKRIPDGDPYARGKYITFHSGICKGVRIVKGNGRRVQPAVVLDGKRDLIFLIHIDNFKQKFLLSSRIKQ